MRKVYWLKFFSSLSQSEHGTCPLQTTTSQQQHKLVRCNVLNHISNRKDIKLRCISFCLEQATKTKSLEREERKSLKKVFNSSSWCLFCCYPNLSFGLRTWTLDSLPDLCISYLLQKPSFSKRNTTVVVSKMIFKQKSIAFFSPQAKDIHSKVWTKFEHITIPKRLSRHKHISLKGKSPHPQLHTLDFLHMLLKYVDFWEGRKT